MVLTLVLSGLVLGCIYGLIALGYSLIYKASGMMNFAEGDLLTVGAFLGWTLCTQLGIHYLLSIVITAVVMFFLGFFLEKTVIRTILNKTSNGALIILATISVSYILKNGSQFIWGAYQLTFPGILPGVSGVEMFGRTIPIESLMCVGISAILMFGLHLFMNKTKFGTAMRAAALDPMAAKSCGINVSLTTGVTWGISAAIVAVGGILIGPLYGVFTTLGANIGRKGFASAVAGGYGNMYGAIIGGIVIGLIETFIAAYVSSAWKDLFTYLLLLVFLFVKPTGLFNEKTLVD